MTRAKNGPLYDVIVIGSGFGGSMVAHVLVNAGLNVLMLERGDWVRRGPHNWEPNGTLELTPFYSTETPYRVLAGGNQDIMGAYSCVGGPSVFYGAVSMRFRPADFERDSGIIADSGAQWPYRYSDLEPYYTSAERILNIAGEVGRDPTDPPRSAPYPQPLPGLSETSRMIEKAALRLGLKPFRLPLAINYLTDGNREKCIGSPTCDTFACPIQAKNDLATCVLPDLIERGLRLKTNKVAVQLVHERNCIVAVKCFDKDTNEYVLYRAKRFVVSAGALGSPHLLLSSDLACLNSGGHTVGHYLMRHCNAIVYGVFPRLPDRGKQFHKQLGIHDFYFGHRTIQRPSGKLGTIQQVQTPPIGLVHSHLPKPLGSLLSPFVPHLTGLLVMAEDQPRYENHVTIDWARADRLGLPQLLVTHRYTDRDYAACNALLRKAKRILRKAGAWLFYVHEIKTFSHAVGTVRMGVDPSTSALDENCQFRGVENLYVIDGSFMPTSVGLNPSLTISANALRVGDYLTRKLT